MEYWGVVVLLQVGRGEVLLPQSMSSSVARQVLQLLEVVKILFFFFFDPQWLYKEQAWDLRRHLYPSLQ